MKQLLGSACLGLLLAGPLVADAASTLQYFDGRGLRSMMVLDQTQLTGRLLIEMAPGLDKAAAISLLAGRGLEARATRIPGFYEAKTTDGPAAAAASLRLQGLEGVLSVELERRLALR